MSDEWVDGNSIAGALGEIFTVDVTTAVFECRGCANVSVLADTRVFKRGLPGIVVRCRPCDAVLITVVHTGESRRLDLTGVRYLQFAA